MKALLPAIVAGLVATQALSSEHPGWLNQALESPTPNQLAYWASAGDDCPMTSDEVAEIVDGVFIRSRIKPLRDEIFSEGSLYLNVTVSCLTSDSSIHIFDSNVIFGVYNPQPPILYEYQYGKYGTGDASFIRSSMQTSVENAVTDYIRVNFDL